MRKIYRIEYKDTSEPPRHYTSLTALAADNPREKIGVSIFWLQKVDLKAGYFGKKCSVFCFEAYNKSDVLQNRAVPEST